MATVMETIGMTVQEYFDMLAGTVTQFRCADCMKASNVRFKVRNGYVVTGCWGCGADTVAFPVRVDKGE